MNREEEVAGVVGDSNYDVEECSKSLLLLTKAIDEMNEEYKVTDIYEYRVSGNRFGNT